MKLNIVTHNEDIGLSLGISKARMDELSDYMDVMGRRIYGDPRPKAAEFLFSQVLEDIAKACNTNEELIWAVMNHLRWLQCMGFTFIHGDPITPTTNATTQEPF